MSSQDPGRLFPDLQDWDDGRGISALTWVSGLGTVREAMLYSALLWPEFVEHRGCLLWSGSHEYFDDWVARLDGDLSAVERMMNHCHLVDLARKSGQEHTEEQLDGFGRLLQEMWQTKLRRDFPHLDVRVELYWADRSWDLDAQITVYVAR